jgi:transcriptional regulator
MLKTIVGFRIEINRYGGEWKPSQNRPEGRRRRVVLALAERPDED